MIISSFDGITVKGISVAVPKNWVSIESLKNDENNDNLARFEKNTGIMGHFLAHEKQTASDFCYAAAESIISKKELDGNEIGILVFLTQYPDYKTPSTACILQSRLGLSIAVLLLMSTLDALALHTA